MDYYKVNITALPAEEWLFDVIIDGLADKGFESFSDAPSGFEAFIPADFYDEKAVNSILEEYENKFSFKVEKTLIKNQNWNREWEDNYFKPVVIADDCLIRGPLHKDYPNCRYEIVIEPGMSFGTGYHETTVMMIEAMLRASLKDKSVLDLGCGTGILSILASKLEASSVTAVDIDERAIQTTVKNSVLNNIPNIEAVRGDISAVQTNRYDFILSNLYRNILISNMKACSQILNDEGCLFLSGFFTEDIPVIKGEAEKCDFKEIKRLIKNNWVVLVLKKGTQ
jgi:ribosomal protein L11 methyltransferase